MFENNNFIKKNSKYKLPVAKIIVPDWGDKVNSGIGLSYRPASGLHRLASLYDNPMRDISPSQ